MAKVTAKTTKDNKALLIALLLGDGTISNNYSFKLSHSIDQLEYLEWKLKELDALGIRHNGIKRYKSKCGYNAGASVIYSQLKITPTIKALRRVVYRPSKTLRSSLLRWLTPKGLAIWYMDDGHMSINNNKPELANRVRIATCTDLNTTKDIMRYFSEVWSISFGMFREGGGYSLRTTSEKDTMKFIAIVKPYVLEVPSMWYKLRRRKTREEFKLMQSQGLEVQGIMY